MKIATWNIERLRHKSELALINENCERVGADILVLTETDSRLSLKYKSLFSTTPPKEKDYFSPTETRVTICTNYEFVGQYPTFDEHTAACVELKTELGNMLIYGTVIGIYGNRHKNFMADLQCQITDIERLAEKCNLCVVGDFNCSFSDNYYFTKSGRAALDDVFARNDITLLTRKQLECIDHIAVSNSFINGLTTEINEWNLDKTLSDHKGIIVELK